LTSPGTPLYPFEERERADEDAGSAGYDQLYHGFPVYEYWDSDFADFVAAECVEGDRILDLGCGPGSLWPLWQRLPSPSRLVGTDLSSGMIEQARRKYPDGEFVVGRAHELPFESGSFDVVVASAVLHHIPDEHLPAAFAEIVRVLDEHGRIVGREPKEGGIAQTPGWLSGAVMNFRHLAYRVTRSREFPEPALGDHHHVYELERFRSLLEPPLTCVRLEERFAFSGYVTRVRDRRVAAIARALDRRLAARPGTTFYYVAHKNYATASDVSYAARSSRAELEEQLTDEQFLAYLEAAAEYIERVASDGA
jgi:ubiquinone/menaquinone biosynthesis C-methylase UbiE